MLLHKGARRLILTGERADRLCEVRLYVEVDDDDMRHRVGINNLMKRVCYCFAGAQICSPFGSVCTVVILLCRVAPVVHANRCNPIASCNVGDVSLGVKM